MVHACVKAIGKWRDRKGRAAESWVSKNLQMRSQVDTDSWHGWFDTQTGPTSGVSGVSQKRAVSDSGREGGWSDEPVLLGIEHQLASICHAQLGENVHKMDFHRALRDISGSS
jgi:hypothetical protein